MDRITNKQINAVIATSLGYIEEEPLLNGKRCWVHIDFPNMGLVDIPDFCNDLNAMHEAEIEMFESDGLLWHKYASCLDENYVNQPYTIRATARQRAEAYLETLNLWK